MKPRWPRFSLRTLVIVVLAVAVCWTLTATWGVSTVFNNNYATQYMKERNGNTMRLIFTRGDEDVTPDKEAFIHGLAIAPFVIHVTVSHGNNEFAETYFWFFGYDRRIHSTFDR